MKIQIIFAISFFVFAKVLADSSPRIVQILFYALIIVAGFVIGYFVKVIAEERREKKEKEEWEKINREYAQNKRRKKVIKSGLVDLHQAMLYNKSVWIINTQELF